MTDILLRDILGADFDRMPAAVRRMHSIAKTQEVHGTSRVVGGKNPLSRLIRATAALPKPTSRAPIYIRFVKGRDGEEWDRHFGSSRFHTIMKREGRCLAEHLVAFPVTFVYEVRADSRGFSLHVRKVRFLGIPLPRLLRPNLEARAREWRGRYQFSTLVGFWFCGRVISYFGYLDAPRDAEVRQAPTTIVYDGMCHLCSRSMAWIARRASAEQVRFVPVQTDEGAAALKSAKLDALNPQSFLVVENGRTFQKTKAVIILLKTVGGKWKLVAAFLNLLPTMLTDKLYDWVAANRYKWFGRRESCFVP